MKSAPGNRIHSSAIAVAAAVLLAFLPHASAQQTNAPGFWGPSQRIAKPDLSPITRLRFVTTVDFFPFNYIDSAGILTGFHVDLVRRICAELSITDRCQIQALPWKEIRPALEEGRAEAIVAGLAITPENRKHYLFSQPYMRFPARVIAKRSSLPEEPITQSLSGKRVGVLGRTTHERLLRDLFPDARAITYSKAEWIYEDLQSGKIDAVFGDGMRLSFWLASPEAKNCCGFAGGPYMAQDYLGQGLAIAVPAEKPMLAEAINFALHEIEASGAFTELYQRYFPVSFY